MVCKCVCVCVWLRLNRQFSPAGVLHMFANLLWPRPWSVPTLFRYGHRFCSTFMILSWRVVISEIQVYGHTHTHVKLNLLRIANYTSLFLNDTNNNYDVFAYRWNCMQLFTQSSFIDFSGLLFSPCMRHPNVALSLYLYICGGLGEKVLKKMLSVKKCARKFSE